MRLLIPNAKELNTNQDSHPWQPLSAMEEKIVKALQGQSIENLVKFYKLNPLRAEQEWMRWQRLASNQAKTYPAWLLYDGLMYRYLKRSRLTTAEQTYLSKHLRIATALYGLIAPTQWIAPHRLDFQGKLMIGDKTLKQFWRKEYDKELAQEELIISLLSSEFEHVFSPHIRKRMTRIVFMECHEGKQISHSTISKKGRGRLVSLMAEQGITQIEQIKELSFDHFHFSPDLSNQQKLTFLRQV